MFLHVVYVVCIGFYLLIVVKHIGILSPCDKKNFQLKQKHKGMEVKHRVDVLCLAIDTELLVYLSRRSTRVRRESDFTFFCIRTFPFLFVC